MPILDFGLTGGGGGAPTNAPYIVQTPVAGLSAEQALSSLATGLLKNSTGTGILSIADATDIPDLSATYLTLSAAAGTYQPLGSYLVAADLAPYATLTGAETLANKTFTTPTIGSFANATHSHLDAAGGGTITAAAISDLATASVAFSNKTGNVSQWTNDASYTTLAAVAGVGYALTSGTLAQFAATTSLQLKTLISDETGSGALVFADTPTLVTPILGTPQSGVLTSCTGLPLTTGVTGILAAANGGTGVANTGTITLGGNLTTSGAFATTFTMTAATGVTFPTTGTLATLAGAEAFTNKTGNISQWTNDSGYLTAVTAHNVLSATHGDTLAGTVVRGDVIIGNSTPKWSRLAIGSASRYLSSDGTDVSWGQVSLTAGVTGVLPVANGGTNAASASITAFNNITGYTAAGATGTTSTNLVFSTSPTLVTPVLGVATATSINAVAITAPASSATLTIADGKTFTVNQTLTLTGTTGTTMTFPTTSATIARTDAGNTFAGNQDFGSGNLTTTGTITGFVTSGTKLRVTSGATLEGLSTGLTVCSTSTLGFSSTSSNAVSGPDAFFSRGGAAATIQLGADVNGAAVNQTLWACSGITGTDKTGGNLTLASGKGTGAGAVSSLIFQTPTVLTTGTTAQSLATRLTVTSGLVSLADATDLGIGTSTGSKIGQATSLIGFYGVTPIVRAVLATGAGATVDNVITALQNLGLVKQS